MFQTAAMDGHLGLFWGGLISGRDPGGLTAYGQPTADLVLKRLMQLGCLGPLWVLWGRAGVESSLVWTNCTFLTPAGSYKPLSYNSPNKTMIYVLRQTLG